MIIIMIIIIRRRRRRSINLIGSPEVLHKNLVWKYYQRNGRLLVKLWYPIKNILFFLKFLKIFYRGCFSEQLLLTIIFDLTRIVFRTLSNIYCEAFLQKWLIFLVFISQKSPIIDHKKQNKKLEYCC